MTYWDQEASREKTAGETCMEKTAKREEFEVERGRRLGICRGRRQALA